MHIYKLRVIQRLMEELSQLEIQRFDAIGEHKCEEDRETHQNCSNWAHEVRVVAEMVFNIPFHSGTRGHPRHVNGFIYITIL